MTYAPKTLMDAREYIVRELRVPANAVGIVGDSAHRGGYHCGANRVVNGDYSVVESSRDRKGLTNAASALDIGTFTKTIQGKKHNLFSFNRWLVDQCRKGTDDTKDIREVIYSLDGKTVKRWDRLGRRSSGDSSHLWHTHISYFRDSESRDKTALFKRFVEGDDGVSAKDVWNGYFINKIDEDSGSSSRMRAESYLAWIHEYSKRILAGQRESAVREAALIAAVEALAGSGGADPKAITEAAFAGAKKALSEADITVSWGE